MTFRTTSIAVGLICISAVAAAAQEPVHVLASNGMKAVIQELQPRCERAIGHPLAIEYNSTTGLMEKIDGGVAFDVAILTAEGVDELVKKGKVAAGTRADFARTGIGVAVRSGAAKPDISTQAALKRTLQSASSFTYAGDGASRPYIDKMLARLGLVADTKGKIVLTKGSGAAMASVAAGQVQIVITLMSELLPVHGIDVVGPLPADLQSYVRFGAAASVQAHNAEAAKALIAFLGKDDAAPVYKSKGMEALGK